MKVRRIKSGSAAEFYINDGPPVLYNDGGIGVLYEWCTPSSTSQLESRAFARDQGAVRPRELSLQPNPSLTSPLLRAMIGLIPHRR